jgi:hypothetical protein
MSIIISFIAITFIMKSASSISSNKVCVYGSPMGGMNDGIQGEYTYGGTDSNNKEYWKMPVGDRCLAISQRSDILYVRYSQTFHKWEISYSLNENCYYYGCGTDTTLPSDCGNNNWYGASGLKKDFYIIAGECPPSKTETYLTVTDYSGYWQGCNGKFMAIDGKKDLYKRVDGYDYGWGSGAVAHYWLYSIYEQEWVCDRRDLEDTSMADYSNRCGPWTIQSGMTMNFHD